MITVVAEKPSVARELAALLGATSKKEGYLEGNGYFVTWALGHLIALGLPEDYGVQGFRRDALPIIPSQFLLTPRKGRGAERLLPDKSIVKQLVIIGGLFARSNSIIAATDAGREGELIFRYIYEYLNCQKDFKRLWVSSLTEKALRHGLDNLLPGSDFDNLYLAARARSRADWLVGINASQALSVAAGSGTFSLGRVQTPTLGIICRRYDDYNSFTAEKYWQLQLTHTKSFTDFVSNAVLLFDNKEKAEEALKSIQRKGQALVSDVTSEILQDAVPLLFDLTALQKAANRAYGFTAAETLEVAQGLYEKQFITYPRTGSKYITEDLWEEIPGLIRGLAHDEALSKLLPKIKFGKLNRHIVNEGKVTDHHGLLVTDKVPSALPAKEKTIYQMIALRLLEAVSDTCVRESVTSTIQVLHYEFRVKAVHILEPGWRGIQSDFEDIETMESDVPELSKDDPLNITGVAILEKQHKGPQLHTEATLLTSMENSSVDTKDPKVSQGRKNIGLGTPATRAGVIETLFQRQYIERKGKALVPTEKGMAVYQLVADMSIASASLTSEWESALAEIEDGTLDCNRFQQQIEVYTRTVTAELLQAKVKTEQIPELLCPKCGKHNLQITEKVLKCPDEHCKWLQFRTVCGVTLNADEIVKLISDKETSLLQGMKSKSGKSFAARLVLNEKAEVSFAFDTIKAKGK